jgi:hypothetical protein
MDCGKYGDFCKSYVLTQYNHHQKKHQFDEDSFIFSDYFLKLPIKAIGSKLSILLPSVTYLLSMILIKETINLMRILSFLAVVFLNCRSRQLDRNSQLC